MAAAVETRTYVKAPTTSLSGKNQARRVKRKAARLMTAEKWDRWKRIGLVK
jgi:hypothetical protein